MASQDPGHRVAQTLGFRLAFWYGAIFIASALLIIASLPTGCSSGR